MWTTCAMVNPALVVIQSFLRKYYCRHCTNKVRSVCSVDVKAKLCSFLTVTLCSLQNVTISPPNSAISIDFRPIQLKPDVLQPVIVAFISFTGEFMPSFLHALHI